MEEYAYFRSIFMTSSVLAMAIGFLTKDDKQEEFKYFCIGAVSALLAIASAISAKG